MRVAVILGAAVRAEGPSPALRRRIGAALALWHDGAVDAMVACGAGGEAAAIAAALTGAGVPADAIRIEDRSRTTEENLRHARPVLRDLGAAETVIVTDWYHAPRVRLVARRLGLEAGIHAATDWRRGIGLRQWRAALREAPALAWYWVKVPRDARD